MFVLLHEDHCDIGLPNPWNGDNRSPTIRDCTCTPYRVPLELTGINPPAWIEHVDRARIERKN